MISFAWPTVDVCMCLCQCIIEDIYFKGKIERNKILTRDFLVIVCYLIIYE